MFVYFEKIFTEKNENWLIAYKQPIKLHNVTSKEFSQTEKRFAHGLKTG